MLALSQCQQLGKIQRDSPVNYLKHMINKVASELVSAYDLSDISCILNTQTVSEAFKRNNISYKPSEAYQQFSFEVERTVPELDYYKIRVKLAHFSLTVSVARFPEFNSVNADICGNYGSISFIELEKQAFCIKTFSFKSHQQFQLLFPAVVKEWTILKICSVLECAPYMPKFLGFDLIIFEDCVQYATEKGEGIGEFSLQDSKQLKQQLALMHSYKIVHLDIKPENVVFSRHLGKAVFIDFGFSEIIDQQFGYKTLITFKGTPNFCSSQMLAIMLEGKGFIDLYYNDAYSLKLTLAFRIKRNLLIQYEQQRSKNECFNIRQAGNAAVSSYTTYPFQYYYLQSNQPKAKQSLRICLNFNSNNAKKILWFVKQASRFIFLRQIFENDLKKYSFMIQYKQVEDHLRQNALKFFYKASLKVSAFTQEENQSKQHKFGLQSFCACAELTQNFQNYLNILLNLKELEEKNATNFVAIAFQCIRFDLSNLEVSEKKQLACKMNVLLLKYLQREISQFFVQDIQESSQLMVDCEKEDLKPIKLLLLLIFEFCLTQKNNQTKWIKKHIFDVCQQMILIDICFLQYIDKLTQYVREYFIQPKDEVLVMFEYARLRETASIMDSSHVDKIEVIQHSLDSLFREKMNHISQFPIQQMNAQNRQIIQILFILQRKKDNQGKSQFENEENRIKYVEDFQIKKYLLLCLTKKKIGYYIEMMCPEQLFQTAQFIKRSSDLQSLDFLTLSILIIKILEGLHNKEGVNAYCKYIENFINCKAIFRSLIIKEKRQYHNIDSDLIQAKVRNIVNRYQNSLMYQIFVGQIFQLLVLLQATKLPLDTKIRHQLIHLYNLYQKICKEKFKIQRLLVNGTTIQQLINIYFYIKIEFFFFKLSEKTQDVFLKNYSLAQQKFHELSIKLDIVNNIEQRYKLLLYAFDMNFYQLYYHIYMKNYQFCFDCMNQLQTLLKSLRLNSLLIENIRLEIDLAVQLMQMQLIEKGVIKLYSYCCQNDLRYLYLLPINNKQFYVTLVGLQASNRKLFYKLLNQLTVFLYAHPLEEYVRCFLFTLDKFLALNRARGYALHFSNFIGTNGYHKIQQNPYLLIFLSYSLLNEDSSTQFHLFKTILLHCDRLSRYAKKRILERSFEVYFRCLKSEKRHQSLFVFRRVKEYIVQSKQRRIIRDIVKIKNRNIYLIKKQNKYIKYIS